MLDKIKADIAAIHAKVALWEDEAKNEFERLKQEFLDLWVRNHGGEVPIENQLHAAQSAHDTIVAASNNVPVAPKPVEPTEPPKPEPTEAPDKPAQESKDEEKQPAKQPEKQPAKQPEKQPAKDKKPEEEGR